MFTVSLTVRWAVKAQPQRQDRPSEKWFWNTLVDADPGSNPASWQWVAGSGEADSSALGSHTMELTAAGITLGKTYPEPIVDHKAARARALAVYAKTRT